MNSSKVRYRLSPNEEAGVLQQERDRRRKLRIQQVREQERAFAKHIRNQVEMKKQQELKVLAMQLKDNWMIAKEEEQQALKELYQKTLDAIGGAHLSAETQPPYDKIREETKVENDKRAKERGKKAFQRQQEEDEKRLQEEFSLVMARKTALEIERARAALIAKKPSRKSDLNDAEVTKEPTRVLHQDGFSTTHYTIPTEYAEKADPEEQGDAKQAAREEEKRMKEEMREKKQELEERKTKASLRQKHAQEKEQLEKDLNHLLEELGQMEQADRRRRQLVVSNIPKQIFVPPHRRLEEKEENQKDLEQAFENMYMAKTDYAGDIELALEPALPQVEADLDLSSDISEEHFKIPQKTEPKRFPQGLDEVKKMLPTGKRDTLRKLLLKVQSQKHDHKLRKKTEISQQIVDGLPIKELSTPSEVTESVSSSGITPSSVTTESSITKTSSSTQTSSDLSQHPLSSSETNSRHTSSVSGSLETGPISDESSSNGKSTLMHPLEAANRLRKKEKDEENVKMKNHERCGEEQKYEEFHPLQEQRTFPEKTFDNMRESQSQIGHLQDQNLIYQEEEKFGTESGESQSQEEISESFDESKNDVKGRSIAVDVKVPASSGSRKYEDDNSSSGTADFQPLEPSQMNSMLSEPQRHLAMGTFGVGRLHEGDDVVDIPSQREDGIFGRGRGDKMQRPDEDTSRRYSGSLNKESVQQTDERASVIEAPSQSRKKQGTTISRGSGHQGIHSSTRRRAAQGGMPTKFNGLHSNQLIRDISPSHLESVRRAYPNIYEAVTGKNRNEVDSDVDSCVPSVEDAAHHMDTVTRMTGGDVRMDSDILDVNRKLSSKEMTSFGEIDGTGSKVARPEVASLEAKMKASSLEVGTGDEDKGIATESEISEKNSDELIDPTEEFRSSLHDYQEQLLKLQRTNELQLLEAQAQLQQRRQRLMDLYPQIQLPAYKPYIPAEYREVLRKEEEKGGSGKEDEENEKRSGRMDSTVNDTTGRKMDHRSMSEMKGTDTVPSHHAPGQGRELRTDIKGNYFEEMFQNRDFREMNSGLQGSHLGTAQGRVTDSTFVRSSRSIHMGGKTQPLQDVLRGSRTSDQGPVHLQSFSTPPLHSEGSPSASGYGSTNLQLQSQQMEARRLHEAQNEPSGQQMCPQEFWGTPHVDQEEIGQPIESNGVSQAQMQDEMPEAREMPIKGNSEHSSFPKVESMPKKSPHGVWRPVKELRVSLPSVEMLEQSPLTTENTSLFSEQGSSFTRTPTTESHGPSGGAPTLDHSSKQGKGQQFLLTPRKLAQLDEASSFNLPVDQIFIHGEPKVNQMSLSQEALSPRKLITPSMLVGERVEAGRTLDTHLHEEKKVDTSCEGGTDVLQCMDRTREYPAHQEIPQYREENKMTSYQEIPTDDFAKRLESQRHFQKFESFKRDFHFQGMNQTSKSSPELILPQNGTEGLPQSQTMSVLSLRSQSESSLDMGTFSKCERVGSFYDQQKLFGEDDSVVLNRKKETMTQESLGMGRVTTNFGQISTGFNQNLTNYDQMRSSYDQIPTSLGQVPASKFSDDEKDLNVSSKDPVTPTKDMSGSSHIIEDGSEIAKDHGNLEEPTDRGLLEALKNLMLAKARRKVPGAVTGTTNYFSHLDLTSSGSEKTKPHKDENNGLKNRDAPSREIFETEKETDNTEEKGMERSAEELKAPMVRHRIHHKPPIANQSKLLALEEMAPHELSTIIEVETPVFENLRTFPFPEDIEKEVQRSQNGPHRSFDEGVTSSSDWGTPHHHTPGSSQGSGSNQSQEIYIHQPMLVSSVEELEEEEEVTMTGEKSGRDDAMGKESSKGDLSITSQTSLKEPLTTSSVYSMSSEVDSIRKMASKDFNVSSLSVKISSHEENLDDITLSEGPISTSSENSFNIQQVLEQGSDAGGPLEQDHTSNQLFPLSSEVLKMRSPRHDQKLASFEDKAGFQYQIGMKKSSISYRGATSISDVGLDYKDSKGEGGSPVQSFSGVTIEPDDGDLTLEEGPLQETLTGDGEFTAPHNDSEVDMPHPDPKMSFRVPSHVHQDPSELVGGFSVGFHSPDKATVMGQFEESSLQGSEGSHQGFFADIMGLNIQQAKKEEEDMSGGPSSYSEGTTLEQATSEAGIMEEPELTFQTTFDTNVTLESVQQDEIPSNPSDSLLSFIRHEEQFAHSTPLKAPNHLSPQKVQPSPSLNQGPTEPSEPLTLQDALARHKASFIKASQARQKEVKVHAGTKSQAGSAFALTIKNWQKAKLEAQQKNRTRGMKKQTDRNKENVETRSKVTPKAKTSQDRKAALKADKERTKRLYNQLEEVRQRKIQSERQKSYAENRQKRKEYEEKMKQRRLQLKNQSQKT